MDLFRKMIDELKATRLPTVIYGAGICAKKAGKYLEDNGVKFEGYSVDKEYFREKSFLQEKPVYMLEKYVAENECNIIIAFMDCPEATEQKLRSSKNIKNLYAVDFPGKLVINEDNQISEEFYQANESILKKLRNDLQDEESKIEFDEYILQKRTGAYRKQFSKNRQYFDKDIIRFSENEIFVDCGAFDGDSVIDFISCAKIQNISSYDKIYAFEADEANVEKMRKKLSDCKNIEIVAKGVYDRSGSLYFSQGDFTNSRVTDAGTEIKVVTIDETVKNDPVSFIKMDIEGSELKELKGAEKTIKRCKPKLAICVYHRPEDLITIPQYIQSLNPDYKLYFRSYCEQGTESVIYAI